MAYYAQLSEVHRIRHPEVERYAMNARKARSPEMGMNTRSWCLPTESRGDPKYLPNPDENGYNFFIQIEGFGWLVGNQEVLKTTFFCNSASCEYLVVNKRFGNSYAAS